MTVLTKIWSGATTTDATTTAGDVTADANWQPISLRNTLFQWTASGSGTNEYYLEASGGGNPTGVYSNFVEPATVNQNSAGTPTRMTAGTAGSLAVSEWDWADNDTLGFSTIYVRTSGEVDPDSLAQNTITMNDAPAASDNVIIPAASTTAMISNLDISSIAIGDFIVEAGYLKNIGNAGSDVDTYLAIDPDRFEYAGEGIAYIDIGTANIGVTITATGTGSTGERGLYLKGANIATASVSDGDVGIAVLAGETATVAAARVSGGSLWLGEGVTLTTWSQTGGTNELHCAATTASNDGGILSTFGTGAITTLNANSGTTHSNSTGTVTTVNLNGGIVNTLNSNAARTFSNVKTNRGSLLYNPSILTVSAFSTPDYPVEISAARP